MSENIVKSGPLKTLKNLIPLLALGALACNPDPSPFMVIDAGEEPEPRVDAQLDFEPVDMVVDMAVDLAVVDLGEVDGGDMGMVDMLPTGEPPTREETIVLTNRDDGYVGWVRGGRLYSARFEQGADAVGDVINVADASSVEGRLRGYRLTGSRPYVVLPSGEGGALQAIDLTGRGEPTDLELYPPFEVFTFAGDEALLVGQLTADEGAQQAWRVIGIGNELGDIVQDRAGFPLARSATRAMGGWIIGFDDVACLDTTRSAIIEAPWLCRGRPGARLVGDGNERLSFVGPTEDGIRMWQAMPAVSVEPEGDEDPALRVELVRGAIIDWFPQPTDGQLAHIVEDDGNVDTLWWIRANAVLRAVVDAPEGILGMSVIKSELRVVRWDEEADQPTFESVEFAAGPTPPTFDPPMDCNAYAAEQCVEDKDCDGVAGSGLCCRVLARRISTRLERGDEPQEQWFIASADIGLLTMMVIDGEGRLYRNQRNQPFGQEVELLGMWENVVRFKAHFGNNNTQVVTLAEVIDADNPVEEGEPPNTIDALLWYRGVDGPQTSPTPCPDVRGLRVLDGEGRTRVWCSDGAIDVDGGQAMGDAVPYPEGTGTVHWIEPNAFGEANQLLVAHGEEYTLSLWTLDEEMMPIPSEEALPMEVTLLSPEDRMLPIRLPVVAGGFTARVSEGALQVLEPGVGWQKVPGTKWPISAEISRYEPVALSVGFSQDPANFDTSDLAFIGFYLHSLQPGTQPWGQRYDPTRMGDLRKDEHYGTHFGDYPVGIREDPIFVYSSGSSGNIGINATQVPCEP